MEDQQSQPEVITEEDATLNDLQSLESECGKQWVNLGLITIDAGTQSRKANSQATIDNYAEQMREDRWHWELEPLPVLFYDGTSYYPGDGHHRIIAADLSEANNIYCDVRAGSKRDAIFFSASANKHHGLARSKADKRNQVELLLQDEEWQRMSDRAIAEHCGVSAPFVGKVRAELITSGTVNVYSERLDKNGREISTGNIGTKPKSLETSTPVQAEAQVQAPVQAQEEIETTSNVIGAKVEQSEDTAIWNYQLLSSLSYKVRNGSQIIGEDLRTVLERVLDEQPWENIFVHQRQTLFRFGSFREWLETDVPEGCGVDVETVRKLLYRPEWRTLRERFETALNPDWKGDIQDSEISLDRIKRSLDPEIPQLSLDEISSLVTWINESAKQRETKKVRFWIRGVLVPKATIHVALPRQYRDWRSMAISEIRRQMHQQQNQQRVHIAYPVAIKVILVGEHSGGVDDITKSVMDVLPKAGILPANFNDFNCVASFTTEHQTEGELGIWIEVESV